MKRAIALLLSMLIAFSTWPVSSCLAAERGVPPPQMYDPREVLSLLPGQKAAAGLPAIPNPLRDAVPRLPNGMPRGVPQQPGIPGIQPEAVPAPLHGPQDHIHPVNIATGRMDLKAIDLRLPGKGFGFELERTYRPDQETGALGTSGCIR
jgi:hypothetical protein